MGGGEVLKKGSLIKSPPLDGGALKMWHKRWFILLSSKVLEYYKSDGGEQKGVINLEDCHSINSNLSHKRYKHVFNIETKERVYFLVAKSQSEMDGWVGALCRVCGLHTEAPVIATLPSTSSSKSKGPTITTPIYSTYTLATQFSNNSYVQPISDSLYSLAAANTCTSDYDVSYTFRRDSAGIPAGGPVSEARGSTSNRASAASGGSGVCDVAGNRLSETAFFSPRPGDNMSFLERDDPLSSTRTEREVSPGHRVVSKARSVTLAPNVPTPTGLEHRSHTHVSAYTSPHHTGGQIRHNGTTDSEIDDIVHLPEMPYSADSVTRKLQDFKVSPTQFSSTSLDEECAGLENNYGVLSMPPPIDRTKKPQHDSPILPPVIDRALKPGQSRTDFSNSPDDTPEHDHHWSVRKSSSVASHTSVSNDSASESRIRKEITEDEEQESQFKISEIPQVTVRTTHYTQVDFNPDKRRPIPLPRKTSSASSTPTTLVPKPRRVAYTEVDLNATDRLHRQMTVREAEREALKEKQYVNVDRSGEVDDETDPDYYTHMRDLNFEDSDEPQYVKVRTNQKLPSQPPLMKNSLNDDIFSGDQKSGD